MRYRHASSALAAVVLALVAGVAYGQGITATVNRTEATLEDQILLTITVEGSQQAQPRLPELPDFEVHPAGQSSQLSIVNGRATSSIAHSYVLIPRRTGTFTVGSATVELEGVAYSSRPFQLRIVDAAAEPAQERELYITHKVSTTRPYVGQQVIYTWAFYRRVRVADARLGPQTLDGFLVEDLGEVSEYQTVVGGQQYLVSEIKRALFPQEQGKLTIPPSSLSCQVLVQRSPRNRSIFDDFFGATTTQNKILRAEAIELEVQPLPPPPLGFTGLVGRFDVAGQISKQALQVGESATLTVTVSGSGNAQMISEPALPDLTRFKVYDDKPSGSVDRSGATLSGSKAFRKALVPLEPGELAIPSISLTYFDPGEGAYRTARTSPIVLHVSPAVGAEDLHLTESIAPSTGKVAVRILADDILPISKDLEAVAPGLGRGAREGFLVVGLLLPALAYVGLLVGQRRSRRFRSDKALRRRHRARRTARKSLARLAALDGLEAARQASSCLRTFIGDKLGLEGSALTPDEVHQHLVEAGVSEELVERVHRLLGELEAAQYGALRAPAGELKGQLEELLAALDRQLAGGGS